MSHAVGDDFGNGWLKTASAGSNAWQVRSWKASDSVVLDATPGAPTKLKRMVIRHVSEPSTQLLLLQKGDADIARNLNPEQLKAVKGKPDFTMVSKSLGTLNYIALNQGMPELAHPDVIQAVKWAIDYNAIATNITPGHLQNPPGVSAGGLPRRRQHQPVPEGRGQGEGADETGGHGNRASPSRWITNPPRRPATLRRRCRPTSAPSASR